MIRRASLPAVAMLVALALPSPAAEVGSGDAAVSSLARGPDGSVWAGLDYGDVRRIVGDELEQRFGFSGRKGWGFSVEDMVSFGLANTVYLGRGRYERDSTGFRRYLAQISADDCRALMQ